MRISAAKRLNPLPKRIAFKNSPCSQSFGKLVINPEAGQQGRCGCRKLLMSRAALFKMDVGERFSCRTKRFFIDSTARQARGKINRPLTQITRLLRPAREVLTFFAKAWELSQTSCYDIERTSIT